MKKTTAPPPKKLSPLEELERRTLQHTLANYYHRREAVQLTGLHMETISYEEGEALAEAVCFADFTARFEDDRENESEDTMCLVRLIAGIAAAEDHEYRQELAERVIRHIFNRITNAGNVAVEKFMARVNAEVGGEGEA